MQGTIKKLTDKNFGFISQEGEEKDLFFHASQLDGVEFSELQEGDNVTFEVEDSEKGPRAANVQLSSEGDAGSDDAASDDDASDEADSDEEASEEASEEAPAEDEAAE